MQNDRRAFLRVLADFAVEATREDGERFAARTVNVCAGGAKIGAPRPVEQGEVLSLEVRFQRPQFLVFASATVVRVEQSGLDGSVFAVCFDGLDRYVEQRIVRWVFAEDRRIAERRAAVRVPVQVLAWCEPAEGTRFRAGTVDLAADGARIITDRPATPGARLRIELDVDEPAYHVAAVAEVAWAHEIGGGRWVYGLRFDQLDRPTQRRIVDHALHAAESARRA